MIHCYVCEYKCIVHKQQTWHTDCEYIPNIQTMDITLLYGCDYTDFIHNKPDLWMYARYPNNKPVTLIYVWLYNNNHWYVWWFVLHYIDFYTFTCNDELVFSQCMLWGVFKIHKYVCFSNKIMNLCSVVPFMWWVLILCVSVSMIKCTELIQSLEKQV